MGKPMSDCLRRISTGWVTLAALLIFVLFLAVVLPNQAAQSEAETGEAESPDTSLFYTPADLYRMAEAYGPEGRRAYIRTRFTFDLIWPLVYAAFLTTAISWLYQRAFQPEQWVQQMNLVPVMGALLDYMENSLTSFVMWRFPQRITIVAALAGGATLAKWILVGGSFGLLLIGVGVALWRWVTENN